MATPIVGKLGDVYGKGRVLALVHWAWPMPTRGRWDSIGVLGLAALVGFAMFSSFLLIPQFAQTPTQVGYGFGSSVTEAGLIMLPSAPVMLVAGPFGGWMGSRIGFRLILATGAGCAALALAFLTVAYGEV